MKCWQSVLIIFVMLITANFANGEEWEAVFRPSESPSKVILPGEIFDGVIQLWPYVGSDDDAKKFLQLENHDFLGLFYIVSVDEIRQSENSAEVLELIVTAILKKNFSPTQFYIWNWENKNIPLKIKDLIIGKTEEVPAREYVILEQKVTSPFSLSFWPSIFVGSVAIVLLIFIAQRRMVSREKRKLEIKHRREVLKQLRQFRAVTRPGFESLYNQKEQLQRYIVGDGDFDQLIKKIAIIRYQKDWSKKDLNELRVLASKAEANLKRMYGI